jgi:excisionase family DNA binding protein
MPPTTPTTLLDFAAAAAILGIPRRRVREMAHRGEIPTIDIGPRTRRIDSAALAAWLAARAQPARED